MAKKFFYVCAGMLLLALAYHFGATNAQGQAAGTIASAHDTGLGSYVATPSGSVYFSLYGTLQAPAPRWTFRGTISSVSPIVHIGDAQTDNTGQVVVHAFGQNGDFFVSSDDGRTWSRHGNVFGAPTPALQESWGQLKSRYAPNRGTAQPGTGNP